MVRTRWRSRFRRFIVRDESMQPTLVAGQGLIGLRRGTARVDELRVFQHPDDDDFWMVKRVAAVDGDMMTVRSDNTERPTVDSQQFGSIPIAGSYRVVVKIPIRWM